MPIQVLPLEECYNCQTLYDPNVGSYISRTDAVATYGESFSVQTKYMSQECFLAHTELSSEDAARVMPNGLPKAHTKL